MELMKRNNYEKQFPSVFSAFDDLLGRDFFGGMSRSMNMPSLNVEDKEGEMVLSLAIPGLDKEDVNIEVDNGVLTISAEKEEKRDDENSRYEYNYSSFQRAFVLPEHVNAEEIEAHHKNGELKIHLPKTEVEKHEPKKIEIS